MTLMRISPFRSLAAWEPLWGTRWLEDVNEFVNELWASPRTRLQSTHIHPVIDMFEDGEFLVLRAELPGITREEIDLSFSEGYLVIKAEKKSEEVKGDKYVCERSYGRFYRSISLPYDVDTEKISATFENGLLEVRMPKSKVTETKQIQIKVK